MVNKSINTCQNKENKQIIIIFVDFRKEKYRDRNKVIENKENI